MKNKLSDLNNHLFAQIERLGDEDLDTDQIEKECKRASAMTSVADQILSTASLQLKAAAMFVEHGEYVRPMLPMIEGKVGNE